jgi:hypothetical protein
MMWLPTCPIITTAASRLLSIIVRRQFSSGSNNNLTNQVISTAGDAVTEFAFNKLNNLIAQSNIKNFDLNIRSFNEASASLRFFNDRLSFNGSLFTNTASNDCLTTTTLPFLTKALMPLTRILKPCTSIRKDGNLTARYSYRILNSTTLNNLNNQLLPQYVNGLGLVYQRDFDTFREFIRNLFRSGRRPQAPVTPLPVTNPNPIVTKPDDDD